MSAGPRRGLPRGQVLHPNHDFRMRIQDVILPAWLRRNSGIALRDSYGFKYNLWMVV